MYDIILGFITAFILTYLAIPSIIRIAEVKKLFDEPGERSSHTKSIPSLGGIAIFAGVLFAIIFWTPFSQLSATKDLIYTQYTLCAFIIIFLIGAKDDIEPLSPKKKFGGQIIAALILVLKANVVLTSFYGIFGINEIPMLISIPLSMFVILLIINAFNLIDGVNGLAGSIGGLIALTFGYWFYLVDRIDLAIMAFCLVGAIVAFLKYNYSPAEIFMGDTGSLLVGLICAILAINFIEINKDLDSIYKINSVPAVTVGVLIIPLFDTLRVFITRALRGKSPFYPDKTHIHHLFLKLNFSHMQTTYSLVFVNVCFIVLVYLLQDIGALNLLILLLALASVLSGILYRLSRK